MMKYIRKYKVINICALCLLCAALFISQYSFAKQDSAADYKIITLNSDVSEVEALEIVKEADPEFFDIDYDFAPNLKLYARYVDLEESDPKKFIVLTSEDTSNYYCTVYGCPYNFYAYDEKEKTWKKVLSLQAFGVWRNVNTVENRPDDIIRHDPLKNVIEEVWTWNKENYRQKEREIE